MIWVVLAVVLGLAAFVALLIGICGSITWIDERGGRSVAALLGVAAVATAVLTFGCVKSAIAASRHYGTQSCESFAEQTGYEVRYLVTTAFDGGQCYVLFGGNWVPKGQLWAELGGRS